MKKILVLGASFSSTSINKQLANYSATLLSNEYNVKGIDLKNYQLPVFSVDIQKNDGIPQDAHEFLALFNDHDGLILSVAEHNRNICSGFKNVLDWVSRIDMNIFKEKPILLMSTSPGGYGGQNARNTMEAMMPMFKGKIVAKFSLPKFHDNFSDGHILDEILKSELKSLIDEFEESL